jgi:hypothetical protein
VKKRRKARKARKTREKSLPLFHPVYRFGSDVKKLVKRAKDVLTKAEQRLEDDFKRKGKHQ